MKDMMNKKIGRLTVIKKDTVKSQRKIKWICKCECGNITSVIGTTLRNGNTKSCGCLQKEKATKHGLRGHILYERWRSMNDRCFLKEHKSYTYYGEKGITVCEKWRSIEGYVEDLYESFSIAVKEKGIHVQPSRKRRSFWPDGLIPGILGSIAP